MPTADQAHASRLHGEALAQARDLIDAPELDPLLGCLADAADNPTDRAEVAVQLAGQAYADLLTGMTEEDREEVARHLIAAGLILESGPIDRDRLQAAAAANGYLIEPENTADS